MAVAVQLNLALWGMIICAAAKFEELLSYCVF
jgi:hypothetical protein